MLYIVDSSNEQDEFRGVKMKKESVKELITLIFKAVSLAMGVAVVALSVLKEIDTDTAIMMLSVGVTGLGILLLMNNKKEG